MTKKKETAQQVFNFSEELEKQQKYKEALTNYQRVTERKDIEFNNIRQELSHAYIKTGEIYSILFRSLGLNSDNSIFEINNKPIVANPKATKIMQFIYIKSAIENYNSALYQYKYIIKDRDGYLKESKNGVQLEDLKVMYSSTLEIVKTVKVLSEVHKVSYETIGKRDEELISNLTELLGDLQDVTNDVELINKYLKSNQISARQLDSKVISDQQSAVQEKINNYIRDIEVSGHSDSDMSDN